MHKLGVYLRQVCVFIVIFTILCSPFAYAGDFVIEDKDNDANEFFTVQENGAVIVGNADGGDISAAITGMDDLYVRDTIEVDNQICFGDGTDCMSTAPVAGQGGFIGGSGTQNRLSKFDATGTAITNSGIIDTSNAIAITIDSDETVDLTSSLLIDGTTGVLPATGGGSRFMYVPSLRAIRAGTVSGTDWDLANIGLDSAAFGNDALASGRYSFSAGLGTEATGNGSVAMGFSTSATANYAAAIGGSTTEATGQSSIALGNFARAWGANSAAIGYGALASGPDSFSAGGTAEGANSQTMGYQTISRGDFSTALGYYADSTGVRSFAAGNYLNATADNSFIIGTGSGTSTRLVNNQPQSLMVGFGSTSPTLFVNGSSVGVGTITPGEELEVNTTDGSNVAIRLIGSDNDFVMGIRDGPSWNGDFIIADSSTLSGFNARLLIDDSSGDVGIGSVTPTEKLTVAGNISLEATTAGIYPEGIVDDEGFDMYVRGGGSDEFSGGELYLQGGNAGSGGTGRGGHVYIVGGRAASAGASTSNVYIDGGNIGDNSFPGDIYLQSQVVGSGGDVAIGSTSANAKLDIQGDVRIWDGTATVNTATGTGDLYVEDTIEVDNQVCLQGDCRTAWPSGGTGGVGDVVGPGSATDNAIARFDSTTGKLIQNSGVIISDTNAVSGILTLNTGHGANELYAMNQNVQTTDSPTFAGATLDSVQVGVTAANEIDTTAGNLILDSAGGTVQVTDNLQVDSTATINGILDANGAVSLGDGGDTVAISSSDWGITTTGVGTGFDAFTVDYIRIGVSGTNEIDTSLGNLVLDSNSGITTVDDNAIVAGYLDVRGNIYDGVGDLTINDNVDVTGTLDVNGDVIIRDPYSLLVESGLVRVSDILQTNGSFTPSASNTYSLGNNTHLWQHLYVDSNIYGVNNIYDDTGTGNFFELDASCTDNSYITGISAAGLITCTAESGDIAGVTAGDGLINGGTFGTVTLDVNPGNDIDIVLDAVALEDDIDVSTVQASSASGLRLSDDSNILGVFIEDGGQVGIGHASPSQTLDVSGTAEITGNTFVGGTVNIENDLYVGPSDMLEFRDSSSNMVIEHQTNTGNLYVRAFESGDTSGNLILQDIAGDVGIGTASPDATLDIDGSNYGVKIWDGTATINTDVMGVPNSLYVEGLLEVDTHAYFPGATFSGSIDTSGGAGSGGSTIGNNIATDGSISGDSIIVSSADIIGGDLFLTNDFEFYGELLPEGANCTTGQILEKTGAATWSCVTKPSGGSGGVGDVVGPGSATDNAIARFDSTTGKLIQNSQVTVSDTGVLLDTSGDFTIDDGIDLLDYTSCTLKTDGSGNVLCGTDGTGGDIDGVTAGLGLYGGGTSGTVTLGVDLGLGMWTDGTHIGPDTGWLNDYFLSEDFSDVWNENGDANDLRFEGDTEQNLLFLDGSADAVGIGTSSPSAMLTVADSTKDLLFLDTLDGTAFTANTRTGIAGSFVRDGLGAPAVGPVVEIIAEDTAETETALVVRQDGSQDSLNVFDGATEVFTIEDGGDVGIGTNSPGAALDVNDIGGAPNAVINAIGDGTQVLNITSTYQGHSATFTRKDRGGADSTPNVLIQSIDVADQGPALVVDQDGTGDILNLRDGATEVFTVEDGGDVGIGNTNPVAELDVQGNVIITDGTESCTHTSDGDLCVDNDFEVDGNAYVAGNVQFNTLGSTGLNVAANGDLSDVDGAVVVADTQGLQVTNNFDTGGTIQAGSSNIVLTDAAGNILGDAIVDGSIDASELATDSVAAAEIAAGAVGTSELATGAVYSVDIQDNTIQEVDLEATNSPIDNYILSYDSVSGGFTWVTDATGSGDITAVNSGVGTKGGATSGSATIEFDCSEVSGNGLTCSGESLLIELPITCDSAYDKVVWSGSSWDCYGEDGDIAGVTAGLGLYGGGTSGTVTLGVELGDGMWTDGTYIGPRVGDGLFVNSGGIHVGAGTGISVGASSISATLGTTIEEGEIAQNTLDDSEIEDNSLTAVSLATNSVGNDEMINSPTFTDTNQNYVDVIAGNDYGIRFWSGSSNYMISMGNDQDNHATVTDYSMHFNMGATSGRGFTFGSSDTAVSASINALTGDIATSGDLDFNGEIMPDGVTCNAGEILKKTGADNWDCAADNTGSGMTGWDLIMNGFPRDAITDGEDVGFDAGTGISLSWDGSSDINIGLNTGYTDGRYLMEDSSDVWNELGSAFDFRFEGDTEQHLLFLDGSADAVGIGTSTPGTGTGLAIDRNFPLILIDSGATSGSRTFRWDINNDYLVLQGLQDNYAWKNDLISFKSSTGRVGIATINPGRTFDVNGQAQATGFYYASDARLKENIQNITAGLDAVEQLRAVSFDWINKTAENTTQLGFIAQEVSEIIPQVVDNSSDYLAIDYPMLVPVLTKAIQEQQAIIDEQEEQITTLQSQVDSQEQRLATLEAQMAKLLEDD